mmetsp:Transcript_9260/g.26058  ORF Transcript_9260/g.26058 Transcript_9260/m.26058 type:complete len:240 (+) Transcript_9260:496-1215(+)
MIWSVISSVSSFSNATSTFTGVHSLRTSCHRRPPNPNPGTVPWQIPAPPPPHRDRARASTVPPDTPCSSSGPGCGTAPVPRCESPRRSAPPHRDRRPPSSTIRARRRRRIRSSQRRRSVAPCAPGRRATPRRRVRRGPGPGAACQRSGRSFGPRGVGWATAGRTQWRAGWWSRSSGPGPRTGPIWRPMPPAAGGPAQTSRRSAARIPTDPRCDGTVRPSCCCHCRRRHCCCSRYYCHCR